MSRSRTQSFRRSVIQVAAAFAALPACGTTAPGTGMVANPPLCEDEHTAGCMPAVDCRDLAPEPGAPCATEGESCTYEYCASAYESATCVDGTWQLEEAPPCNPPEHNECPDAPPQEGTPCDADVSCGYDSCNGADGVSDATCLDGTWQIGYASCNPPPPEAECPSEPPVQGAPCGDPTLVCDYDSCSNASGAEEARCVDYAWQVDDQYSCNPPEPVFECPADLPAPNDACDWGAYCQYGVDGEIAAECDDNGWSVHCSDGGNDCGLPAEGCPWEPPVPGAACSHVGETCAYGKCSDFSRPEADCVNGAWEINDAFCELGPVNG
jgi:hypothetical protein